MILKIVEGLLSTIHLMYNNHFKQTIGKIIEIPNLTEEDPRLVEKVRVLNFFRFLLFSRWWSFSSISVWIAKLVICFFLISDTNLNLKIIKGRWGIWIFVFSVVFWCFRDFDLNDFQSGMVILRIGKYYFLLLTMLCDWTIICKWQFW